MNEDFRLEDDSLLLHFRKDCAQGTVSKGGQVAAVKLTAQLGFDAHRRSARAAKAGFIFRKDPELVLGGFHQAAHGELSIFGTLFGASLPGAVSSLPKFNPVAQNLLPAIVLGPEPVNGDAVFSDGNHVNLSWLAGFV